VKAGAIAGCRCRCAAVTRPRAGHSWNGSEPASPAKAEDTAELGYPLSQRSCVILTANHIRNFQLIDANAIF
jgi:hypothetical protein